MTSFTWLLLAVIIAVVAAVTGIKAKGTRPVAGTRLMGVARIVLLVVVVMLVYMALRARAGV